jgi:PIN domain nuclease of toxin-antitoxin system
MTKGNYRNNQKNQRDMWKKMKTTAILLSAVAFISSSVLTSGSISVLAAAPSSNISSINQTKTLDHMLVQNLTKTNVPVTLPLTRGYVKPGENNE